MEKKVYEMSFNIVPTLDEEGLAKEFGNIKDAATKLGAVMIAEQYPAPLNLAYSMVKVINNKNEKFSSAYFGWLKFEMDPAEADNFKKMMEGDEKIIRFLTIKTVRESTLAPKKVFRPENSRRKTGSDSKEEGPMDKEAVDKKIEELSVAA